MGRKMKVSLKNKKTDCKEYGLNFDSKGICEADKKVVESLIDAGLLVEVKSKSAKK